VVDIQLFEIRNKTVKQSDDWSWGDESFLQMIGWEKMGYESDKLFFGGEMGKFVV